MHEQNTLMYNIILFENELKMEKIDLNIIQRNTWWRMSLPRHYLKNDIITFHSMPLEFVLNHTRTCEAYTQYVHLLGA
jgi:hypothetical protein